jgi:HAD superfamily hydrolase (TIGR01662 family)
MPKKLLLFDLDGTLVPDRMSSLDPFQRSFMPGVKKAIYDAGRGTRIVVITNQSQRNQDDKEMVEYLEWVAFELMIDHIYFATKDTKEYLKPNPSFVLMAMKKYSATPEETIFIGNNYFDEATAVNAGIDYISADIFFGDMNAQRKLLGRT